MLLGVHCSFEANSAMYKVNLDYYFCALCAQFGIDPEK
ncbi:hypothetical protein PFLA_a2291 [Pseudoalteromonas flavipulchra NCIMB 2033 = ATCC BAA-314]|nr:hypothetical protein [Pseudoalteromonas flavipulchra NCIMB 2033 = ATCC BAA-314]